MGTKGVFDPPSDVSFQLEIEGKDTAVCFDRTGPATARVSWNIPVSSTGCENKGTYCGIVVTLDTVPASASSSPVNGTVYVGDPTGDRNLHAGSKIGTALVIGAFYEDEQKAGNGEFTVSFDISGLQENTAYYVSGYIHDCQNRYFLKGSHAYSLNYGDDSVTDTHGSQIILLNNVLGQVNPGVKGTDATGLTVGELYCFEMLLNDNIQEDDFLLRSGFSNPDFPPTLASPSATNLTFTAFFADTSRCVNCQEERMKHRLFINGSVAQTFDELMDAINSAISLIWNPIQSPVAPNTGLLYYDVVGNKLFQWDGLQHVELPVIVEATDPSVIVIGTFWFDTTNQLLKKWNGAAWDVQNIITYHTDPTTLGCTDYWFDGTDTFVWNGSTWCKLITHAQVKDPSCPPDIACGSFWYDTINEKLNEWDVKNKKWNETFAIFWPNDPNSFNVGDLWFNDTTTQLYEWNGTMFNVVADATTTPPLFVTETQPTNVADGSYWFKSSTEEFFKFDLPTTTWNLVSVLIWPENPLNRETCDLWWNSTTDVLSTWDVVNGVWDPVVSFVQTDIDPSLPQLLTEKDVWYNTVDKTISQWIGNTWEIVTFINFPTDPMLPVVDQVWFNTTNSTWQKWNGTAWVIFDPIDSLSDPVAIVIGTFWFDTTSNILKQWNGTAWDNVTFSTMPLTPAVGSEYFNTTNNTLLKWDGTAYVPSNLIATSILRPDGSWMMTSGLAGSRSKIRIAECKELEAPGANSLLKALGLS